MACFMLTVTVKLLNLKYFALTAVTPLFHMSNIEQFILMGKSLRCNIVCGDFFCHVVTYVFCACVTACALRSYFCCSFKKETQETSV